MLKADYDLQGERLEVFERGAHIVINLHRVLEIGESAAGVISLKLGEMAELVMATTAVTALGFVAAALECIAVGLAILDATQTDTKLAGMQAIGYAATAWAFGDAIPSYPSILSARNSHMYGEQVVPKLQAAWQTAADATVRNLVVEAAKKRV